MARYLINVTETYRVDSENEVAEMIEQAKKEPSYELTKYNCVHKMTKEDEWYRLSMTKAFNAEKEPSSAINIHYGILAPKEENVDEY